MTFAQDVTEALPALRAYARKLAQGDREQAADLWEGKLGRC